MNPLDAPHWKMSNDHLLKWMHLIIVVTLLLNKELSYSQFPTSSYVWLDLLPIMKKLASLLFVENLEHCLNFFLFCFFWVGGGSSATSGQTVGLTASGPMCFVLDAICQWTKMSPPLVCPRRACGDCEAAGVPQCWQELQGQAGLHASPCCCCERTHWNSEVPTEDGGRGESLSLPWLNLNRRLTRIIGNWPIAASLSDWWAQRVWKHSPPCGVLHGAGGGGYWAGEPWR